MVAKKKVAKKENRSSGAGEFHPYALTEPYVRLSPHTALMAQSNLSPSASERITPGFV